MMRQHTIILMKQSNWAAKYTVDKSQQDEAMVLTTTTECWHIGWVMKWNKTSYSSIQHWIKWTKWWIHNTEYDAIFISTEYGPECIMPPLIRHETRGWTYRVHSQVNETIKQTTNWVSSLSWNGAWMLSQLIQMK
jgi:hypothetical protein